MTGDAIRAAVGVELRKSVRARVPLVAAALLVLGVVAISASVIAAASTGPPEVVAKLGPVVRAGGWAGYVDAALQVTGAAGAGACGILISWSFGREFAEGTISGLFALPVSRTTLAAAKLVAFFVWTACVTAALIVLLLAAGFLVGLGAPAATDVGVIVGRVPVLLLTTAGMTVAAAWVSTISRGLMGGIATTVVLLATAQVIVFSGGGAWFPPSAPALWALAPSPATTATLLWSLLFPVAGITATIVAWHRLQLDR
jgi:ABC-2 type transport system permease protein